MKRQPEDLLRTLFTAAVNSAQPQACVPDYLPPKPAGRVVVVGAGKASAAMAQTLERHWDGPLEGLVVTAYGHAVPCERIEIVEAAHPVPDETGRLAAARILQTVGALGADDLVIALISGGGSALLPLPAEGVSLDAKQQINRALLKSGASISEINCVRRHLSAIKGGRLAAACFPASVVSLVISDVPGDDLADIASGPTVADTSTCQDALDIIARYAIPMSSAVRHVLESGLGETIKPGDQRIANARTHLIATPQMALQSAAAVARENGYPAYILGDSIEGEARDVAKVHAAIVQQIVQHQSPFASPCILLSGGETTVTVRGTGRGGRNVEFLLALGLALKGQPGVFALAADTDGIDGLEPIAGAVIRPDSIARSWSMGINPVHMLADNDAHSLFERLGDSLITGPTLTNVNDFRAILIE